MISRSWVARPFCSRWSRRSSVASISSWTRAAAVVKPTLRPFWQAARPRPSAMCVLPVPDGPSAMTFSRRSTKAQRANSIASTLLREGIAVKSKLSRLLVAGNFAALMRRSIIRRSRSISSSSQSRSRYWTCSLPSAAHCRASLACSDWKVGSLSFLRWCWSSTWGVSLMLPSRTSGSCNSTASWSRPAPGADRDRCPGRVATAGVRCGTAPGA